MTGVQTCALPIYKKIAFVSGALIDPINGQNRLKGYKEALSENNLPYSEG